MKLQERSGVTLYYQLKSILKEKITSGQLKPDDKIDNELDMAQEYGVSRATVRQAVLELAQEGIVIRKRGKGTFVAPQRFDTAINFQFGYPPELGDHHETLAGDVIQANEEMMEKRGISAEERIYKLVRMRFFKDEPVAIETMFFPLSRFPGIDSYSIKGRAYDFLYETYHVKLEHFSTEIEPVLLTRKEISLFSLKTRSAGLILTRVCQDEQGKTILWHHSLFRGDRCRFLFR